MFLFFFSYSLYLFSSHRYFLLHSIRHRFDVGYDGIEQWVQNVLPSRSFGANIDYTSARAATTYGIMDQDEARRKKTGGKILGFFY